MKRKLVKKDEVPKLARLYEDGEDVTDVVCIPFDGWTAVGRKWTGQIPRRGALGCLRYADIPERLTKYRSRCIAEVLSTATHDYSPSCFNASDTLWSTRQRAHDCPQGILQEAIVTHSSRDFLVTQLDFESHGPDANDLLM